MNIKEYKIKYEIGSIVYLITDEEQEERMVTSISLKPGGCILYGLSLKASETYHYDIEICRDLNILKKIK